MATLHLTLPVAATGGGRLWTPALGAAYVESGPNYSVYDDKKGDGRQGRVEKVEGENETH